MYNETQKKATIKYLAKLKEVRFRVKPEEYEAMQKAAEQLGFASMRQFFLKAIEHEMERNSGRI